MIEIIDWKFFILTIEAWTEEMVFLDFLKKTLDKQIFPLY
jgi:hypothetical protein